MFELPSCADEVHPGLWVSAMPEPDWPLDRWGVSLVVSVSEHLPPQAARRFEWGARGDAHGQGAIVFIHWPFEDGPLPDLGLAELVVMPIVQALHRGRRVLVHCQEGRNRSGLIAALAVHAATGASGAACVEQIRAARAGMLTNRTFFDALVALPRRG